MKNNYFFYNERLLITSVESSLSRFAFDMLFISDNE